MILLIIKILSKTFKISLPLTIAAFLISCNGNVKVEEKTNESGQIPDTSQNAFAPISETLDVLYLTENEFRSLVTVNNTTVQGGKLSFQFSLPETNQNPFKLTMVAWPFQSSQYHNANKIYLKNDIVKWPLQLNRKDILGGQKLKNGKIQQILDSLGPDPNDGQIVAFQPFKPNGNDRIRFNIGVFLNIDALRNSNLKFFQFPTVTITNPSPPANDDPNNDGN